MTLLDEENQKWYCQKDGIVLYGKEQRWTEGNPTAQFKVVLLSATSDDVEIAKRRFRANMRGLGQKNVELVEKQIVEAERKAKTAGQVIEGLKGRQDSYEAVRGLTNLALGGFMGSALIDIGRKEVPLIGSMTLEQEEWVNKHQPDERRIVQAMQEVTDRWNKNLANSPICEICIEPMVLLDEETQRWYCKEDDKQFIGGKGWKKTAVDVERDKQLFVSGWKSSKTIVAMEKMLVHAKQIQCKICKKRMTLINPDRQIWYCENDRRAYFGVENRTQENVAESGLISPNTTNVPAT